MTDAITRPLAALMAALHPGWDVPGCAKAIHEARHVAPWDQLAHAVIAYAMRADVKTPALLATDGPHWRTGRTPDTRVQPIRCDVPGHEHELATNCRSCRSERLGRDENRTDTLAMPDAQLATNIRGAALVRQALTHNPAPTPIDGRSLAAGMSMED